MLRWLGCCRLLLEQARLSQSMGLDLHAGLFPDSFPVGPHQHANLPHYHSYPGPQATPQVCLFKSQFSKNVVSKNERQCCEHSVRSRFDSSSLS